MMYVDLLFSNMLPTEYGVPFLAKAFIRRAAMRKASCFAMCFADVNDRSLSRVLVICAQPSLFTYIEWLCARAHHPAATTKYISTY